MIKFTTKLALAVSVLSLYFGQFVALASDDETQEMELSSPSFQRLALTNTVTPVGSDSALLPAFGGDMQTYLAGHMCDAVSPCRLAQLSKAWHQLVLGRAFWPKSKKTIRTIPFSPASPSERWLEARDLQILNSGTFRYQPEGKAAIDVGLSGLSSSGDLTLPGELADLPLCVTRSIESFIKPAGDNTRKTLVLLLTLSELKKYASQISSDATFLENVARADLSQNAVCALIRYGGDDLAEWGFRYTPLKFREMNTLSFWQIYTHEKVCARGALWWRECRLWGRVGVLLF